MSSTQNGPDDSRRVSGPVNQFDYCLPTPGSVSPVNLVDALSQIFNEAFGVYERNRMYPPGYGKESPMKALNLEHAEAVSAAKLLLIYKASGDHPKRYIDLLEKQIELLGQIRWWILQNIYLPGSPFCEIQEPNDKPESERPQDDGTAAKQE